MEVILAMAVVIAVITFGVLISVGNEHQRRAIDGLREQVALWALQDLRIKREKIAREIHVEDPLIWLNGMTGKVTGKNVQLRISEVFDEPKALVCHFEDGRRAVFTPESPTALQKLFRVRLNRLTQTPVDNPLRSLHRAMEKYDISMLNGGMMFDLELPLVWKQLTGQQIYQLERLWLYILN